MCDSLFETGKYFRSMLPPENVGDEPQPDATDSLDPLEGILSHIYQITQSEERRDLQDQRQMPRAIRKLYRRFLFFKYFIALNEPLIVTEGKTDPVYLREAVRRLTQFHPVLGSQGAKGFKHAVRYFRVGPKTSVLLT